MPAVRLARIGDQKVRVIKILQEQTGLELAQAKEVVNNVEMGKAFVFETENVPLVTTKFAAAGALAFEDLNGGKGSVMKTAKKSEMEAEIQSNKSHYPTYATQFKADPISNSGREETLELLNEVRTIANKLETRAEESKNIRNEIAEHNLKVEALRNQVSTKAKLIIWSVTIIAAIIGGLGGSIVGGLCFGLIALVIMNKTVKKKDLKTHQKQNEKRAQRYTKRYIEPLMIRLEEIRAEMGELNASGKIEWAIDIVGEDFFNTETVSELYGLVKRRRADSLKEVLNLYDNKIHREKMEEMQRAIKAAAEISAQESCKQTEQEYKQTESLGKIQRNTR